MATADQTEAKMAASMAVKDGGGGGVVPLKADCTIRLCHMCPALDRMFTFQTQTE